MLSSERERVGGFALGLERTSAGACLPYQGQEPGVVLRQRTEGPVGYDALLNSGSL